MLRMVLKGLGLALVSGGTLVLCVYLRSVYGHLAVLSLAGTFGAMAWAANALAKSIGEDAAFSIWDLRLSLKEAAGQIDMDVAQASRQVNGLERFDYARWAALDGFEAAFADRRARRNGGYSVHRDGVVAQALDLLRAIVGRQEAA